MAASLRPPTSLRRLPTEQHPFQWCIWQLIGLYIIFVKNFLTHFLGPHRTFKNQMKKTLRGRTIIHSHYIIITHCLFCVSNGIDQKPVVWYSCKTGKYGNALGQSGVPKEGSCAGGDKRSCTGLDFWARKTCCFCPKRSAIV